MKTLIKKFKSKKLLLKMVLVQSVMLCGTLVLAEKIDTLAEGIPARQEFQNSVVDDANNPSGTSNYSAEYTTPSLLEEALDKALTLPLGERISHFENMAKEIVRISNSQKRLNEELLRYTLNRSVDVATEILPVMGLNTEYVASNIANLYQQHFFMAKMFVNGGATPADYGRIYSTLLWRFSAGLTSKAGKAIMLTKALAYLKYDIEKDPLASERSLKEVIADINRLQTENKNYQRIQSDLNNGTEPETVNQLKSDVTFILHKLPGRLQQAGIRPIGVDYSNGP